MSPAGVRTQGCLARIIHPGGHSTHVTDGGDREDGARGPCRPHL